MKFNEMARDYLNSPDYKSLSEQSHRMYSGYINALISVGGNLPVVDTAPTPMPDRVALKRSLLGREPSQEPVDNLCGTWFKLIDKFKGATNSKKLALRTTLSIVYKWGVFRGYLIPGQNFAPLIPKHKWKHEVADQQPFTVVEMNRIQVAIESGKLPPDLECYAWFTLYAFGSGCRPEEMYEHQVDQFKKRDGDLYMEIYDAKGRAIGELSRYVLLGEREQQALEYFKHQPKVKGHDMNTFRTDKGLRFLQSLVCSRVKEVCILSKVEPRAFYNTRRGLATAMNANGYDLGTIASRLGNTPAVAARYIRKSKMNRAKDSAPINLK